MWASGSEVASAGRTSCSGIPDRFHKRYQIWARAMKGIRSTFKPMATDGSKGVRAVGRPATQPATRDEYARYSSSKLPMTVYEAARFLVLAPKRCIFGLSESRFPTSA
jgi:hypothetical protein